MQFKPFVLDKENQQIPVSIVPMSRNDAELTNLPPVWQTSWTSEYLAEGRFKKYAAKVGNELIALGAYEVLNHALVVHIVYMEAQPESNPNLDGGWPKFTGIGRLMIAYGIKLSIDNGFAGDVVLEAKTTELARHYETDLFYLSCLTWEVLRWSSKKKIPLLMRSGTVAKTRKGNSFTRYFFRCARNIA